MKKDLGTEADSLNNGETKADSVQPLRGAIPKIIQDPIRKRAYHRALKRGAGWALMKKAMNTVIDVYAQQMYENVFTPSKLIGLRGMLEPGIMEVPIVYPEVKKDETN